jgi:hypothetical protein
MSQQITIFIERLSKIGTSIELAGNYPWIYLRKVDGNSVVETYLAEHGFTIGFLNKDFKFTDLREIFKIIRKYRKINT